LPADYRFSTPRKWRTGQPAVAKNNPRNEASKTGSLAGVVAAQNGGVENRQLDEAGVCAATDADQIGLSVHAQGTPRSVITATAFQEQNRK
jgi:hypothetical protein